MAGKYKKRADGRYLVQVQIGIQDDGRPKHKNIYAHTIKELEEKAAAFRSELEHGIIVDDQGITLAAWARKWLEAYKSVNEYNTYAMYENAVNVHIIPALGHYKLKNLKPHQIQEMINVKASEGLTRTLEIIKLTLKQILNQAIANGYIHRNACDSVKLPKIQKPKKRSLSQGEKELLDRADLDLKCKAFVYMLLCTGVRREEILALMKKDIDLIKKSVTIERVVVFEKNRSEIKPYPKSDAGKRTIPLPAKLYDVLVEYLPTVDNLYVFPSANNVLMSKVAFRRFWEKIIRKLKASTGSANTKEVTMAVAADITPHLFRHTYATDLYYAGVDIKTAQYLLGHATIEMTLNIYTHLDTEKHMDAAEKLDEYYIGDTGVRANQSKISQRQKKKVN